MTAADADGWPAYARCAGEAGVVTSVVIPLTAGDDVLYAQWTANGATAYTVNHYKVSADHAQARRTQASRGRERVRIMAAGGRVTGRGRSGDLGR